MTLHMATMAAFVGVCLASLFALAVGQTPLPCDDLDTKACQQVAMQRSDLCTDPAYAKMACPRFCNLCPIKCYHCNASMTSIDQCNATKICGDREMCMRKELKSNMDGHREYQLSCAPKQLCDGSAMALPVGKRHVQSRDLTISCCGTDLCNGASKTTTTLATTTTTTTTTTPTTTTTSTTTTTPTTTTRPTTKRPTTTTAIPSTTTKRTTHSSHSSHSSGNHGLGCHKDIFVLVDDGHLHNDHTTWVNLILNHTVDKIRIGPHDALVSVAKYTNHVKVQWGLDAHTNKQSLTNAIDHVNFFTSSAPHGNFHSALNFMLNLKSQAGNRRDADDVVIIWLGESLLETRTSQEVSMLRHLHTTVPDVFAIGLGHHAVNTGLAEVATDSSHVIDSSHYNRLLKHATGPKYASDLDQFFAQLTAKICG